MAEMRVSRLRIYESELPSTTNDTLRLYKIHKLDASNRASFTFESQAVDHRAILRAARPEEQLSDFVFHALSRLARENRRGKLFFAAILEDCSQ